jgi:hypothetical protein
MSNAKRPVVSGRALFLGLAFGLVLVAQNLGYFSRHYFLDWSVPWDFLGTYHAVPKFWIEAARLKVDSAWIPFQAMGYPLYINLQSGLYYPPFWFFVAADRPYTAEAAIVLQGLHVLLGAMGAAVCARLLGMRWSLALLAGVFYQGFGGFYSNASHPDIVRAYALLPWVLAPVMSPWRPSRLLLASIALLPLWVYALCTGGYPGNMIAVLFMAGVVVAARAGCNFRDKGQRSYALLVALGTLAGMLLAGASLLPALMDRSQIQRAVDMGGPVHHQFAAWKDLIVALVMPTEQDYFRDDPTMRSWFISVPVVALLCMRATLGRTRATTGWALVCLLALGMATGVFHWLAAALLPPLGFSRFPMADYKGAVALAAVILGVETLQLLASGVRPQPRWRYAWLAILLAYVGVSATALALNSWVPDMLDLLLGTLIATVSLLAVAQHQRTVSPWLLAGLAAVAMADWARVHWDAGYFQSEDAKTWVENRVGPLESARQALAARLAAPPACRPARIDVAATDVEHVPWKGYYTGDYLSQDYSAAENLKQLQRIRSNPSLYRFGLRAWTASLLPDTGYVTPAEMPALPPATMQCLHYGTTRVEYQVYLSRPAKVVENEAYWPGWTADIGGGKRIVATGTHGFRTWSLPAGRYRMISTFRQPWRLQGLLVSALGGLCCVAFLAFVFLCGNKKRQDE